MKHAVTSRMFLHEKPGQPRTRWSEWRGLNSRPLRPKRRALPSELHPEMAEDGRIELPYLGVKVPCLTTWRILNIAAENRRVWVI